MRHAKKVQHVTHQNNFEVLKKDLAILIPKIVSLIEKKPEKAALILSSWIGKSEKIRS